MKKRTGEIGISFIWRKGLFEREGKAEGSRGKELLIDHPSWQKNRRQKIEERSNSPYRGNKKFERERQRKKYTASDCSFDGDSTFVTRINKISLFIQHLWWFKTLLPGSWFLPSSVGGCQAQPPQQSRDNSNGLPSSLWPSGTLGLMARSDKPEFTYMTSHWNRWDPCTQWVKQKWFIHVKNRTDRVRALSLQVQHMSPCTQSHHMAQWEPLAEDWKVVNCFATTTIQRFLRESYVC